MIILRGYGQAEGETQIQYDVGIILRNISRWFTGIVSGETPVSPGVNTALPENLDIISDVRSDF